jgi:predicted RNase H-like HicB family nuclease
MKITAITVQITPLAEGGFMANCLDIAGLRAYGETAAKAAENIASVAQAWIKSCQKHGDPVPQALQPQERERAAFEVFVEASTDKSVEAA